MKSSASESKPFESRSKGEISDRARRKERLSHSKLKQAFVIDSDAELFMYLIQCSRSINKTPNNKKNLVASFVTRTEAFQGGVFRGALVKVEQGQFETAILILHNFFVFYYGYRCLEALHKISS